MTGKDTRKKPNKNQKRNKAGISRLIIIIAAILIALAFLVFSIQTPFSSKPNSRQNTTGSRPASSPSFRKDGSLSLHVSQQSSLIQLDIEIADQETERMRGLMDRFSLPENAGMLFIFQEEEPRSFWMKNTYISLDIIYINSEKEIVSIQKYTQPQTTTSIPSEKPAMYVLEVNAGFADQFGVSPGDKIDFSRY
jgi:uncharacterized membrane protein (UPF0127 family)